MKGGERRGSRADLRRHAEEKLRAQGPSRPRVGANEDVLRLIHELQVHQVELEMQNEELRRIRAELEATSARYADLYDFAPVAYVTLDGQGTIVEINLVGAALLGQERARLLGQRFGAWVAPATRPALERLLAVLHVEERASCDLTLASDRNGPRSLHLDAVPESPAGTAWRCRVALTDVTEQQRLRERLQAAEKLESLGRLAGGVAHDFNNLLTAILGSAEYLSEDAAAGKPVDRADLEAIRTAGQRASELTRQLLAIARRQVIAPIPLDLNAAVGEAEKLLRRLLPASIALETRLASDLGTALCDATQLQQIVMNLALNARDAMARGGRLVIETGNAELDEATALALGAPGAGPYVRLTVQDSGTGLSAEVRPHLFEPFFTTKGRGQGTGLGLATVYGIVKQSGGCITVESEPGRGTAFHVHLPQTAQRSAAPAAAVERPTAGTETVLIVDDEEMVRAVTVRALKKGGYGVLVAGDAQEALALEATGAPIDLLLTDVVMPGMNGSELAAEMGRRRPGVRVLFVSGYVQDAVLNEGSLEHPVEFLGKPFTASALLARVRAILDAPRGGPGAPRARSETE